MSGSRSSSFLRRVLLADAAASGTSGVLMVLGASVLSDLLRVPQELLFYAGLSLFPFAALVAYVATRERVSRAGVWAVIACNALWALDCAALLVGGWIEPAALGQAFIVAQALVVLVFAEMEYLGLRRSVATTA